MFINRFFKRKDNEPEYVADKIERVRMASLSSLPYHYYASFEKKQEFFENFRQFLQDMGFGDKDTNTKIYSFARPAGKDYEPDTTKEDDIATYVDTHDHFYNDDYWIDLIFGKEKIFMIIASKEDKQEFIGKNVYKFAFLKSR